MNFQYNVDKCQPTCMSLSETDETCLLTFTPTDGCVCNQDLYMNEKGECVAASHCPCYHVGFYYNPGERIYRNGIEWYVFDSKTGGLELI